MIMTDPQPRDKTAAAVPPQCQHRFWLDNFQLPHQIRPKLALFLWQRIAVIRRPILNDISNINVWVLQTSCRQHLVEKFPRCTDEWFTLQIFILARCFADKYDISISIAISLDRKSVV